MIAGHVRRLVISVAGVALAVGIGVRADQALNAQPPIQQPAAPQPPQGAQGRGGPGFTPPRPPRPGETAGEYYKNIKVLKDIPATDLPPTMQFIAASLGVQCSFCHVVGPQGGFDKDEKKPKQTARTMMQMVRDINNRQFEGRQRVGCATCHHGHNLPERTPPLAVEMTPAEAARAAEMRAARGGGPGGPAGAPGAAPGRGEPGQTMAAQGRGNGQGRGEGQPAEPPKPSETIDQVLDKYLQALGGRAALEAARSRVMVGTATTRDLQTVPVKVQEKSTGEFRMDVESRPAPIVRATDGKSIWVQMGPNVRDVEGLQAQQATRLADFSVPLNMKKHYENLTPARYGNIDGTDTILVTGRVSPDVNEQLQFDRQGGLLLRRTILTRTAFGNLLEQVDYSDYREVSGVKVPFQVRYATWNELLTEKFTDVKLNAPIDDAQFARPPRPAPAGH